jgi:AraC-like DNA-binding protein
VETGDARIAKVARRMGMSTRTLQRALAQHGLLFRRVVDEARWELAAPLVTQSDAPIDRIAEQLGYAEAKAFRRAFRRWSGVSPSDMRRAYRAGGSDDHGPPELARAHGGGLTACPDKRFTPGATHTTRRSPP